MDWVQMIEHFGFPISIVIFLLFDRVALDKRRNTEYDRIAKRLSSVEDYIKVEHTEMIKTNQEIIARATRAIENCERGSR